MHFSLFRHIENILSPIFRILFLDNESFPDHRLDNHGHRWIGQVHLILQHLLGHFVIRMIAQIGQYQGLSGSQIIFFLNPGLHITDTLADEGNIEADEESFILQKISRI